MVTVIALDTYRQRLAAHDWKYMYADDYRAYAKGRDAERELSLMRSASEAHNQAYLEAERRACK